MTAPRTKTTIRIDNLHASVTKELLRSMMVPFGEVVEVEYTEEPIDMQTHGADADAENDSALIRQQQHALAHHGRRTKRGRVAHVEFEEPEDAAAAMENMDGAEVYGQVLSVTPARAMREMEEGLSSAVPVWQQEGYLQRQQRQQAGEDDAMAGLEQEAQVQRALPSAPVGPLPAGE